MNSTNSVPVLSNFVDDFSGDNVMSGKSGFASTEVFRSAMSNSGIDFNGHISADGNLHRFTVGSDKPNSKNGWYAFHEGNPAAGAFGCWKRQINESWCNKEFKTLSHEEKVAYAVKMAAIKAKLEQEQAERHAACIVKANSMLNSAHLPDPDHAYLQNKKTPSYGIMQLNDMLLVPMFKGKTLTGLQTIRPDGSKRYLKGTDKVGSYLVITGTGNTVYLVEGWATGSTVHEATGATVIICFDCYNLESVARKIRANKPDYEIVMVADNDRLTPGNPGLSKAKSAALAINCKMSSPEFTGDEGTDYNDLMRISGKDEVRRQLLLAEYPEQKQQYNGSESVLPEEVAPGQLSECKVDPLPLLRVTAKNDSFPIDAFILVPAVYAAVMRVWEVIQAPLALVCQSFLAAMTLAVQPLVDVVIDGRCSPVSNDFIVFGISGERKSAVDRLTTWQIKERQRLQTQFYFANKLKNDAEHASWENRRKEALKESDPDVIESLLNRAGEEPKNLQPCHIISEPSFQGIERVFAEGRHSLGMFSDEGGKFLGGYAMSKENMTNTITGLSKLWDGDPIDRLRGGDGLTILYGRRFSVHLMLQPVLAGQLFGNSIMSGQGFLSRCLCSWPESTIGTRPYNEADLATDESIIAYNSAIKAILEIPEPMHAQSDMGLSPRQLSPTVPAKAIWVAFHNHIELALQPGGDLFAVIGFASKTAEHAARIAAVLTIFQNPDATEIDIEYMEAGIAIAQYYLGEALRLFHASNDDPLLILAEECFSYGMDKTSGVIGLRNLYQFGPNAVRSKDKATRIVQVLESHHRAVRIKGGAVISGTRNRDAWKLIPLEV